MWNSGKSYCYCCYGGCFLQGTMEANEILLQALQAATVPLWYSSHTKKKENAKGGKRGAWAWKQQNRLNRVGSQRETKGWGMEALSRNQKQTVCCTVWFVMGPHSCNKSHSCLFAWFSPVSSCASQMHAFVLPNTVQRQAVGFLHSGVLITASHASCSHMHSLPHPPLQLPHFQFLIYFLSSSLWTYGLVFQKETSPHQRLSWAGQFVAPPTLSLPPATADSPAPQQDLPRMLRC